MVYIHHTDTQERIFEVYYSYEKPEKGSRWIPLSPGQIVDMVITENGVDVTNSLSLELLIMIENACLVDWFSGYDDGL